MEWDFIEPSNFIFPQLHVEIGVASMAFGKFYGCIEEQVELISPEEKVACNNVIIS
jgi:hypothetical protein